MAWCRFDGSAKKAEARATELRGRVYHSCAQLWRLSRNDLTFSPNVIFVIFYTNSDGMKRAPRAKDGKGKGKAKGKTNNSKSKNDEDHTEQNRAI